MLTARKIYSFQVSDLRPQIESTLMVTYSITIQHIVKSDLCIFTNPKHWEQRAATVREPIYVLSQWRGKWIFSPPLSAQPLFYKISLHKQECKNDSKRSNKHLRPVGGNKFYINDTSNTSEEHSEHAQ